MLSSNRVGVEVPYDLSQAQSRQFLTSESVEILRDNGHLNAYFEASASRRELRSRGLLRSRRG